MFLVSADETQRLKCCRNSIFCNFFFPFSRKWSLETLRRRASKYG